MSNGIAPILTPQARAFVNRFRADPDFRAEVEADPKSALTALGVPIPPGVDDVRIVEDTEDTCHVVLPPGPNGELPDDELSGISGGNSYGANQVSRLTGMPADIAERWVDRDSG